MKKNLLICIAYHHSPDRLQYINEVLENIQENYKCSFDIIIDTNTDIVGIPFNFEGINIITHPDLSHPFNLTQTHRQHFKDNIDNYENFMYIEDDMKVPYENYLSYLEKFKFMYPKYVPSFVRIETKDGEKYVSDVIKQHQITGDNIIIIGSEIFFSFPFPENYFGCYIATQQSLKDRVDKNFTRLHDSRERAASFFVWEQDIKGLVEVAFVGDKWRVKENCYIYHLPNNYIESTMPNGKIKVNEIFI